MQAGAIHGDLRQGARERALAEFTSGKVKVLVATDVAARGIHVDGVDVVVHFDPPEDEKAYLHRSGRTARAGESGVAVTLMLWNQENEVRVIQRRLGLADPGGRGLLERPPPPRPPQLERADAGRGQRLTHRPARKTMGTGRHRRATMGS